jgi:SnoaL-like domain
MTMRRTNMKPITALNAGSARKPILQSVLDALNEGRIAEAVSQFDDHFTFTDHALDLEFTDKGRLTEFFQKSRELFPDTVVQVDSTFQCGDQAIAEWKLTATQTVSGPGSTPFRFPISLRGTSIVRVNEKRITQWSDYYDGSKSRRQSLAAFFIEWVEY